VEGPGIVAVGSAGERGRTVAGLRLPLIVLRRPLPELQPIQPVENQTVGVRVQQVQAEVFILIHIARVVAESVTHLAALV
jgi:hypothetical protein